MRKLTFRFSLCCFVLALVAIALTPLSCSRLPETRGWDNLDESLTILVWHTLASGALAILAVVSGLFVVSERGIAAIWIVPSLLWVLTIGWLALKIASLNGWL
jgi:hypothetical protein